MSETKFYTKTNVRNKILKPCRHKKRHTNPAFGSDYTMKIENIPVFVISFYEYVLYVYVTW